MSLTNSPIWFGSGATGGGFYDYEINDSLRFNDNDSPFLNRTPSSAGNQKTWTYSCWVKRANLGTYQGLLAVGTGDGSEDFFGFLSTDKLYFRYSTGSDLISSQLFRDVSSWYHIVVVADTTQTQAGSSASDSRLRYYVNGTQITAFDSGTMPSQNFDFRINSAAQHYIGEYPRINSHLDGYLTEVNFIDGQALDATSFGETKSGVWIPKSYGGSYGTNGFYLNFSNNSTATNLGLDSSGNSNNWSVNGISTTDKMIDTPTNNFAVMNALEPSSGVSATLSEGNLKTVGTTVSYSGGIASTFEQSSGKWYWEVYVNSEVTAGSNFYNFVGAATGDNNLIHKSNTSQIPSVAPSVNGWSWEGDGSINLSGTGTKAVSSVTAPSVGSVLGFAIDLDNGNVYFYHNGTAQNSGNAVITGVTGLVHNPMVGVYNGSTVTFNFGQDSTFAGATTAGGNSDGNGKGDLKYAPPSGYLALCTANLPEPVVGPLGDSISTDNFNPVLYTGNGSTQSITGVGFQPDWTWCKMRTDAGRGHALFDSVRGGNERLDSSSTQEGRTNEGNISFQSDGFNVTSSHPTVNDSGDSAVAWNWKAGGTAVSNTAGTINSQVSAGEYMSICTWTGNGTSGATIGHGLGKVPSMFIVKRRTPANGWAVYHEALGTGSEVYLNYSQAKTNSNFWITSPTTSVFSVSGSDYVNLLNNTYVGYVFANLDGACKAGLYTGNGSSNGTFVYTGFRPAFILVKGIDDAYSWTMLDSTRDSYNVANKLLYPSFPANENTGTPRWDFLSNGFKARDGSGNDNTSGQRYIYLAFAENPFKYANAR